MRSSSLDISVKSEPVAGWMRLVGNSLGRAASNWTSQSTVRAPNIKPLEISVPFTGTRLICLCRYHNSFQIAQGEPTMQLAITRPESIQLQLQAWSSDCVGRPPPYHPRPPSNWCDFQQGYHLSVARPTTFTPGRDVSGTCVELSQNINVSPQHVWFLECDFCL